MHEISHSGAVKSVVIAPKNSDSFPFADNNLLND